MRLMPHLFKLVCSELEHYWVFFIERSRNAMGTSLMCEVALGGVGVEC